jgi:tetratricopeptide (TPR) repeat protein
LTISLNLNLYMRMNSDLNNDIRVNDYLEGKLTGRERHEFEEELKSNRELNRIYRLHARVDEALMDDEHNELRDMLDMMHPAAVIRRRYPVWYKYAAAAILVLSIATALLIILSPAKHNRNNRLFATYYKAYITPGEIMTATGQLDAPIILGLQLYDEKSYDKAYAQFSQYLNTGSTNTVALFYSGASLMALGKYAEAIPFFKAVAPTHDVLFTDQSKWYLALACLKTGNAGEAEILLKDLVTTSLFYRHDAKAILDKMVKD